MKVLMVNTLYPPRVVGGAEKSVALLASALRDLGVAVSVATIDNVDSSTEETQDGIDIFRTPLHNIYWPFGSQQKFGLMSRTLWHVMDLWNFAAGGEIARILDTVTPDIVHTNNLTGFSVAVWREARLRDIPVVHTVRDYSLACFRTGMYRRGRLCHRQCADCRLRSVVNRFASKQVAVAVGNSKYVLDRHLEGGFFPKAFTSVIYNIAGPSTTSPRQTSSDKGIAFGFLGRVSEDKGIEVVLRATELLEDSDWRLFVAGRGESSYVQRLQQSFPDDRIRWLGFAEPDQFFSQIDVAIIPSIWPEPLPRTLLEAFGHGLRVICARSGGIPEIADLRDGTVTYDPLDVGALANFMSQAVKDASTWRRPAPLTPNAAAIFSPQHVSSAYLEVYQRALRRCPTTI